jgi:SAM-dependent methyltransferase
MAQAAYDEIADWYADYIDGEASTYSARVNDLLRELLDEARTNKVCVEVGCGTGARAQTIRELGWQPIGVDLSTRQLRHAMKTMPVIAADATRLPIRSESADAVTSVLIHTDVPDYRAVVREVARVLQEQGTFVHIGIHPAFTGAFADRSDPSRIIVDDGYHRRERRWDSFTPRGVRAKVGAWHTPLAELINCMIDAGLTIIKVRESSQGNQVPDILAVKAYKPWMS